MSSFCSPLVFFCRWQEQKNFKKSSKYHPRSYQKKGEIYNKKNFDKISEAKWLQTAYGWCYAPEGLSNFSSNGRCKTRVERSCLFKIPDLSRIDNIIQIDNWTLSWLILCFVVLSKNKTWAGGKQFLTLSSLRLVLAPPGNSLGYPVAKLVGHGFIVGRSWGSAIPVAVYCLSVLSTCWYLPV